VRFKKAFISVSFTFQARSENNESGYRVTHVCLSFRPCVCIELGSQLEEFSLTLVFQDFWEIF
jgi:hypothetical protein